MSHLPTINELAKQSVLADENDLPALVGMHDRLKALGGTNAIGLKELQQAQADYDAAVARSARLTATLNLLLRGVRQPKLDAAAAPNHVGFVLDQAEAGAYDGTVFHRAVPMGIILWRRRPIRVPRWCSQRMT